MTEEVIKYRLIRSKRKTLGLEVKNGELIARAPLRMPKSAIESLIREKKSWILRALEKEKQREKERSAALPLTKEEIEALKKSARQEFAALAKQYAPLVGVSYGKISIRLMRSRWGSCSAKGDLSFNCLLMLAPAEVRAYIAVHELCHRREMNHSAAFWREVARVLLNYRSSVSWLREHGGTLLSRAGF